MSSSNLTRDEARQRARLLIVDSYDVSLDLTTGDKVFRSETTAHFSCVEDGASVRLDLVAETVHEIVLNGTALDPFEVHREDGLHLKGLTAHEHIFDVAGEGLLGGDDVVGMDVIDAGLVFRCHSHGAHGDHAVPQVRSDPEADLQ